MPRFSSLDPSQIDQKAIPRKFSAAWICFTFAVSYLINLLETAVEFFWLPDFLALTLVFWTIYHPRSIGMGIAFVCGILMDVHNGSVLGQQALAYVTLSYLTFSLHRRLPWFGLIGQALHILPLLLVTQVLVMLVRLWFDGFWPGLSWFLQSLTGALLWPAWTAFMLWPQRREHENGI